jgi:hypothetical protein
MLPKLVNVTLNEKVKAKAKGVALKCINRVMIAMVADG